MHRADLQHPDLNDFETILNTLFPLVFEGGIAALQTVGIIRKPDELMEAIETKSTFRRFIRGCHYGWDEAQHRMSELVISYRQQAQKLGKALKEDRRARNRAEIEKKATVIAILDLRQLVLRRLADTILYHQIKFQDWILRRVMLEYRIREIDPVVLADAVSIATDLNRDERLDFHLVADLTTVMHVGDLIKVTFTSSPPSWSLIELKRGKMNVLLSDIIEKSGAVLTDEEIVKIHDQFGSKAVVQAKRMIRQQYRHRELMKVIETDEGIDIMHETRIKLQPELVEVDDYKEVVANLCERARTGGVAVTIVDDCLRLVALNEKTHEQQGKVGVAHVLYHLQFGVVNCTLAKGDPEELKKARTIYPFFDLVQMNLHAMWPQPMFLWAPQKVVLDLLFGRLTVFGQLDFAKLFERAHKQGVEMRWVREKEFGTEFRSTTGVIPGSPDAVAIAVRLAGKPDCKELVLIGFLSRMFLEFMSPSHFLRLVKKSFEGI